MTVRDCHKTTFTKSLSSVHDATKPKQAVLAFMTLVHLTHAVHATKECHIH
jgi:hypothetical protein